MSDRSLVLPVAGVPNRRANWLGWSVAALTMILGSVSPPVARLAIVDGMNPTTLLVVRMALAALLFGGTIAATDPRRFRIDRKGWLVCTAVGLAYGVGILGFFWSLTRLDASIASMIYALYPLAALFLLALRGERFTYRNTIRLALGLGGVYLLIGPGGRVDLLGVLLVGGANLAFAVHLVLMQWYLDGYDAMVVAFYVVATMAVLLGGAWLVQGAEWHVPGWTGWLAIGLLAVVCTYLTRLLLLAGVRMIGGGQVALLTPLETLFTVIWSVAFLREWLTPWQWMGGALILFSALLAVQRMGRVRRPPPDKGKTPARRPDAHP